MLQYLERYNRMKFKYENQIITKREWEDLRDSEIKDMLDYIAKEIEYEYDDVEDIYGEVYIDGELVAEYDKRYRDSSGRLSYRKY